MKILHILYSLCTGGIETMLVDIANEQAKSEEVHILIINNLFEEELMQKFDSKIVIHKLGRRAGSKNIFDLIRFQLTLLKISPDIIHAHEGSIIKLLKYNKSITCLTVHNTGIKDQGYKYYDKIIAISQAVHKDIKDRTGFDSTIIENGIFCNKVRIKETDSIKDLNFKIVQVSRLYTVQKGQDVLIRAIHKLHNEGFTKLKLDLIGAGESEDEIRQLIKELNLEKSISLLGLKSRDYIYENLCEYNLFLQPSRYEGFGLTVAEAMAAKIPVLVSNIEGPMEIINNGEYGFYFENENIDDCANMIKKIYQKQYDNEIDLNKACKHIKLFYSISNTARKYIEVYKSLLLKKRI